MPNKSVPDIKVQNAQSKGVDLLLWYSSNGFWNDAP